MYSLNVNCLNLQCNSETRDEESGQKENFLLRKSSQKKDRLGGSSPQGWASDLRGEGVVATHGESGGGGGGRASRWVTRARAGPRSPGRTTLPGAGERRESGDLARHHPRWEGSGKQLSGT